MTTTFTLQQSTAPIGSAYQVINTVVEAATYVYATGTKKFSHYASAADMGLYPDTYEVAALISAGFYRQSSVTRTWKTVQQMLIDLNESKRRLQSLADELNVQVGAITTSTTTVITSQV